MHSQSTVRGAIFIALLALGSVASAWAQQFQYPSDILCKKEQLCRRCDGPSCTRVASEAQWPAEGLKAGVTFSLDAFRILLPESPERIAHPSGGGLFVRYAGTKTIAFEWMKAEQALFLKKNAPGGLTYSDIPRIQFTKTPADTEPEGVGDKRIWRYALTLKDSGFSKSRHLLYAKRGPVTLYVRDGAVAETDAVAHLVHDKVKGAYLQITALGFEFDELMQILATIDVRE